VFHSGGRAQVGAEHWLIQRRGRFRSEYAIIDEDRGNELASVRRDGRRRLLEFEGRVAEWKRLGRKSGFGFVSSDGTPLLAARVRTGVLRSSGNVQVDSSMPERERLLASDLAVYLLIRRNEEQAASSAAATTAATS